DEVGRIILEAAEVAFRRTWFTGRVRGHEVELDGLVADVDELDAGQMAPAEIHRPQSRPSGAVDDPERFSRESRFAGFGGERGRAVEPHVGFEERQRIFGQAVHDSSFKACWQRAAIARGESP